MDKRDQFGVNTIRQDIAAIRQELAASSGLLYEANLELETNLHRVMGKLNGFRWFTAGLMIVGGMVFALETYFIR